MGGFCVFCGSASGDSEIYGEGARQLGRVLAQRGIRLIFGGGRSGLMGEIASAVLAAGGEAVGVVPRDSGEHENTLAGLTELQVVDSTRQRKARMAELADGFIALPGGVGTMEEFFEIWSWARMGLHDKPFGLLNTAGYYSPLMAFISHMSGEGFLSLHDQSRVVVDEDANRLVSILEQRLTLRGR